MRLIHVEFVAQELEKAGITVKLDKWNIHSGKRLWEQIDKFITDPGECDAWAIFATKNSLTSEPCKEEIAIALDRALGAKNSNFPIIGIFSSAVDSALIPSAIKTRLYVSLQDSDWIERITSSVEGRSPSIPKQSLEPFIVSKTDLPDGRIAIEMRPRAGLWVPFFCSVPLNEKEKLNPNIMPGSKGNVPQGGMISMPREGESQDLEWWIMSAADQANPTNSYFLFCKELPSKIVFGAFKEGPKYYYVFHKN